MGVGDLVKITTYLVRPEDVAAAGAARAKHFGDARPGSRFSRFQMNGPPMQKPIAMN